ncbi:FitA-like ribbon-helix-helix domain-containing protein [Nocardioides speluncae]|uniref:FitA-like ribbon-helix-helix domain-containing protein n=1 Tax=Nocardioides speluncae TaxID=2670337 RepID=UPI000D69321E|nr:plasmid stabilization protein [Nocardioides speluncae]
MALKVHWMRPFAVASTSEVAAMSTLTVRNLDPNVMKRIQERAVRHGQSMEAEVRDILTAAVEQPEGARGFGALIEDALRGLPRVEVPEFDRNRQPPRGIEF